MAGNIFQSVFTSDGFETGKEGGQAVLADKGDFLSCIVAEYVWLDAKGQTRSKCKTVDKKPENADDCAIWSFNGAETGQSEQDNSDVYLVPRKVFDDPVRGAPHVLVVCEAISPSMEPAAGNFRAECSELAEKFAGHDFWFGFEQEYVCCDEDGKPLQTYQGKEGGDFYCGRGALHLAPKMREIMGDHYAMCLRGGIKISGMNVEQGMAQGEFQIGPCKGINIGDHMVAARHTLHKAANKYRVAISFKAINDGVNGGSGMHANETTKQTRGDGG
jgi:glutamine synthetase